MEKDNNVRSSEVEPLVPLRKIIRDVLDELEKMTESETHLPGLSTGFPAIDRKILGLNKSDLIVLASPPSMGKTSLALNIALNVARNSGKTVAIFSLVTKKEKLVAKIVSMETFINNYRFKTGELNESDWEKIATGVVSLSRMEILFDDNPRLTVVDMREKCQKADNLALIVIDDLQFITSTNGNDNANENRYEIVSSVLQSLKIMARELNVPVLCLSSVNRANEKRDDKRPQLSDLRDSGYIADYADIVMFLYRDEYYNEDSEKHNVAECIVAKNRDGETGTVELRWMPEYTLFTTIETREDTKIWTSRDTTP